MANNIPSIPRVLDLKATLDAKSCFLFGPRQTGKTWLIHHTLKECVVYSLLDSRTFLDLSRNPKRIEEELPPKTGLVVIDEIQRQPELLNEVHFLIEQRGIRFLLTGSSARKLRHGGVNLLGGRARIKHLHPFIYRELGKHFDLERALNRGLLPSIYFSDAPREDLQAYTGLYLQEEIAAEGAVRNVPAFSRFLQVAALSNGKIINYTNISNDCQVARTTVQEYFQILKDTLIGYELPAWKHSIKRKPISTSKFYLFDSGITLFLQNRSRIKFGSPEFGEAFETFIFHELKSYCDYGDQSSLCYWRSTTGIEVDFVLGDCTAIDVKAKTNLSDHDLKGLVSLAEEKGLKNYVCVSLEARPRKIGPLHILPYHIFLEKLWAGDFI